MKTKEKQARESHIKVCEASMTVQHVDQLKGFVLQMNSGQLLALWRWILLEFVQRCREEYVKRLS